MPPFSKILEGVELFHMALLCFGFAALALIWVLYSLWRPSEKTPPPALRFCQNHIYALGFAAMLLFVLVFFLFTSHS